ncbi:MAG: TIGR03905 family TSCPD domain-containing protein [Defluviitaleaceae bacterium]|nr:TIGR03905 family TSCPD domain-containing protein [Defluviitaleaceae bacterium]
MKELTYKTKDVCSGEIFLSFTSEGLINEIRFDRGCHGNAQGIAALAKGRTPEDVIAALAGIKCKTKPSSCPDQLADALRSYIDAR